MAKKARKSPKARAKPAQTHHPVVQRGEDAVAREAAISDILRVISSSPSDLQPVFDTILAHALRLCEGDVSRLWQYDGDKLRFAAHNNATAESVAYSLKHPLELGTYNPTPQAALERRVVHALDVFANPDYRPLIPVGTSGKRPNAGTVLAVPLVRESELLGVITIWRYEKRPFSERQIELVKTFTAQAVIAIQNVRLFNETKDALERQTATADILKVISASPTDVQPVFDAVAERAAHLCNAMHASVLIADGDVLRVMARVGRDLPFTELPIRRTLIHGRAFLERRTVHIEDILPLLDTEYPDARENQRNSGFRSFLSVPMSREGKAIGTIGIWRQEVKAFSKAQIELLETFAAQAVIAIENVRLFNETKEGLEQQTATAEILRVISSSPSDLTPVFDTILDNALRLCEASNGQAYLYDGTAYDLVSFRGADAQTSEPWRRVTNAGPHTGLGRILSERRPVHIPDLLEDVGTRERDPMRLRTIERLGARTFLAVPLLKDANVVGALVIYRREVRPFSDKQIALIKTFAAQAVIAIENVRLFNETKESLEQQTAISEVLRVISSSPSDVKPVLDAVAQRAARICEASDVRIFLVEGERLRHTAGFGDVPMTTPVGNEHPLDRRLVIGRAVVDRETIHVEDLHAASDEFPLAAKIQQKTGQRTTLAVPLLREDQSLGAIMLRRMEVRPFTQKQIALLKTFADQAAIAIQNVRLFNETKESLERETATSEILKVISRTHFDLGPVLEIVLNNARTLCGADRGTIFRPDAAGNYVPVAVSVPAGSVAASLTASPIRTDRSSATGRAAVEGVTVHIPDVLADPEYRRLDLATVSGFRSVLAVPMLREGIPIGVLTLARTGEARPFNDKQIELVTVFADQAVIAIENVRLFNEIQEKSQQLEVANKHKSDFLANMSHELRTPLNAIIGFSEALMERMFGEVNEKQADYLKDIHESGRHLLSLINDILDLSKIEAGRMDLEVSTFHLPTALSNAMTLIRERAQRHGIDLALEVDQRLGEFQADERKFKQIMLNLLSNAVKFTPDGGRVNVCATKDTDKIEIAVKDTGIGIAPEDQAAVFEEFKQVGRDQMRKAEGTGLGLALTRRFVELHGGAIRLDSTPGKGSTFTVSLPLRAG